MLVVRSAQQPDPFDGVRVRQRKRIDVIEFQRIRFTASPAVLVSEGAAPAVASVHSALDVIRNVPRHSRFSRRLFARPWGATNRETFLLHLLDERVECHFDDRRYFTAWH